jgi:predicted metal-dependent phosphoesterase TrpH
MKRRVVFTIVLVLLNGLATASAQVRHEIHFPDLPGCQTLKCDFHTHTVFSDGLVWPDVRVHEAWREGLDAIAITDHIEYQPHRQDVPTNHNRPYELATNAARERDILLIKGTEITRDTPPGHHNAIFLSDIDPLDTEELYAVFEQAHQQQAFVFWNHPGWQGPERGRWADVQATLLAKKQLHGIEVCNGDDYYAQAHRYAIEKNLVMLGDSDIHDPSLEEERTATNHRTLTLVFAKERTIEAIREALFAGRTAVWYQNQLIGREPELAAMFAAAVQVEPPHHRAGDTVWVKVRNRSELDIELERIGPGRPAKIDLPARACCLLPITAPADELSEGLPYRALNFLVGPDQPLAVRLVIPAR